MINDIKFDEQHEALKNIAKSKSTKLGVLIATAFVISHLLIYLTGKSDSLSANYIPLLILFLGVFLSNILFKKNMDNIAVFSELFGNGFKTICLVCLFMIVWILISIQIFPDIKTIDIEIAKQSMISAGYTNVELQEGILVLENTNKYYLGKIQLVFKVYFAIGIIASLISSLLFKTPKSS